MALGIDLVLGKQVFLSVTVMNLQGRARLQFSHKPYTHWSFSFYEEPQIDFLVESKFGGRATPQLTSLIIKQVGKTAEVPLYVIFEVLMKCTGIQYIYFDALKYLSNKQLFASLQKKKSRFFCQIQMIFKK